MAYRENQIILYSADGQYIQGNNIPVLEFNTDVLIEDIIIVDNLDKEYQLFECSGRKYGA